VQFYEAECTDVDPKTRKITCVDNTSVQGSVSKFELDYDFLVVAVGAQPATFGIPGVAEHACFMKEARLFFSLSLGDDGRST
jgi:NADH:ubiquinone reductase (non-electrogenic)